MNFKLFRLAVLSHGMAACAIAAEISLPGGGKLSGDIAAMDKDGTISLVSPFAIEPLMIRKDMALRVDFGGSAPEAPVASQRIELTNGDLLPASVISLEDGVIQAASDDIGMLSIPRDMVSSIQLGLYPQRVIYAGPKDFSGWNRDGDSARSWTIDGAEFVAQGAGKISKNLDLPQKFILKFSLSWDNYPNFQFRFAETNANKNGRSDAYYFQTVGSGIGIFREVTDKPNGVPIALLNRDSGQLRNATMQVEIRVDRARNHIHLYVDGALEGKYTDPAEKAPAGTDISLVNRSPRENNQRVGKITVLEWDDRGDRHRNEERGDGKSDSLIGRNGERLGGKLGGIRKEGDSTVYLFKSDFQREVLQFPEREVSTVFLSGTTQSPQQPEDEGYTLSLRGGAQLRVSSCSMDGGKVSANHPLLGEIKIEQSGILSILSSKAPKVKPVKKR